eukprot:COSAG05_NODE_4438_length_1515_cov_9.778191_1_plen_230_part_10
MMGQGEGEAAPDDRPHDGRNGITANNLSAELTRVAAELAAVAGELAAVPELASVIGPITTVAGDLWAVAAALSNPEPNHLLGAAAAAAAAQCPQSEHAEVAVAEERQRLQSEHAEALATCAAKLAVVEATAAKRQRPSGKVEAERWEQRLDPLSGRLLYFNRERKWRSWTLPADAVAVKPETDTPAAAAAAAEEMESRPRFVTDIGVDPIDDSETDPSVPDKSSPSGPAT